MYKQESFGVFIEYHEKAPDVTYKKFIVTSMTRCKVVHIDNATNTRVVTEYRIPDTFNPDKEYQNINAIPPVSLFKMIESTRDDDNNPVKTTLLFIRCHSNTRQTISNVLTGYPESSFPLFLLADGETETDEPATETITLPFAEEPIWLFQDFMFRRLYPITRNFLEGLNAERVALLTKVDQLAGGVGDDEDHRRYDHAANLGRGLIGYTWEQINILSDDTLPASKKKTRAEIVSLIEKLEATFPDREAIDKFFVRHDEVNWQDVRQNRQIRLVGKNYKPGEILKNINSEHLKTKNGVTAVDQVSAENEYARCVKQCFRAAWSDRRDTPRHTIQYSFGAGDSTGTVPKSQLTDESLLGDRPPE